MAVLTSSQQTFVDITDQRKLSAILTAEIAQAVETERMRRDALYKGTRYTKKAVTTVIPTRFAMKRTAPKYQDPIKQAEYAYSQIKEAK